MTLLLLKRTTFVLYVYICLTANYGLFQMHFKMCIAVLLLAGMAISVETKETLFVYTNSVSLTHSSWLLSLTVQFGPYEEHLLQLQQEIERFHNLFKSLANNGQSSNTTSPGEFENFYQNILDLMERGVNQFYSEYNDVQNKFNEIRYIATVRPSMSKRAVLPFMGSILSSLFGTATQKDLSNLKMMVETMSSSNKRMVHVIDESLSIVNKTNKEVRVNRNAINQLSKATQILTERFELLHDTVVRQMFSQLTFLELSNQLHDVFHIVNSAVRETHFVTESLYDQALMAVQERLSPNLVNPTKFTGILRSIKRQLPNELSLPYGLGPRNVVDYYKNVNTILLPDNGKFHVVVAIPVIDVTNVFEIYEVVNLPIPVRNISLSAKYELQSNYIAISKNRQFYLQLTPDKYWRHMVVFKNHIVL